MDKPVRRTRIIEIEQVWWDCGTPGHNHSHESAALRCISRGGRPDRRNKKSRATKRKNKIDFSSHEVESTGINGPTPKQLFLMCEMLVGGMTTNEVGKHFDVPGSVISYWVRKTWSRMRFEFWVPGVAHRLNDAPSSLSELRLESNKYMPMIREWLDRQDVTSK